MTDNDLFYVCSLIEYTARETKNHRKAIVEALGIDGIRKQLLDAPVSHCLSFEQVSTEIIEWYHIPDGNFDSVGMAKYGVPSYQDIGKLYAILVEMANEGEDTAQTVYNLFSSFLSDEISRFSTDMYYQNPSYLLCCYQEGRVL